MRHSSSWQCWRWRSVWRTRRTIFSWFDRLIGSCQLLQPCWLRVENTSTNKGRPRPLLLDWATNYENRPVSSGGEGAVDRRLTTSRSFACISEYWPLILAALSYVWPLHNITSIPWSLRNSDRYKASCSPVWLHISMNVKKRSTGPCDSTYQPNNTVKPRRFNKPMRTPRLSVNVFLIGRTLDNELRYNELSDITN